MKIVRWKYWALLNDKSYFLKASIMQSHDCAKYSKICANLSNNECQTGNAAAISCIFPIWLPILVFMSILLHVYPQLDCAREFVFRKSGQTIH